MRFFQNGDFTTRSNEVETAYRRVNPDDRDDDGIANERDANPMIYDGISGCRNHPKFPPPRSAAIWYNIRPIANHFQIERQLV